MASALHRAVSLFTILPVPPTDLDRETGRRALLAFPWVGALAGLLAAGVAGGASLLGGGALLPGALGLGVLALITGGMHLDGLADTVDGLSSRRPAAEARAIMKKSDVGPMGVGALVLVLIVDAAALASPRLASPAALAAALIVAPALGRLHALAGTTGRYPRGHEGGFSALFAGITTARSLILDAAAVTLLALGLGAVAGGARGAAVFAGASVVSALFAEGWRAHLVRRFEGLTGDTWGSLVELGQLLFWIVLAIAL